MINLDVGLDASEHEGPILRYRRICLTAGDHPQKIVRIGPLRAAGISAEFLLELGDPAD
jgi:hypothetical protein